MAKQELFNLAGRTALVTGANRGIGRATSLALAKAGANVILGVRNIDSATELLNEIKTLGQKCIAIKMDVTKLDEAYIAIDKASEQMGVIDILVNNVGGGVIDFALDVKEDDFDWIITQNAKSSFFISQKIAQLLIDAKQAGNIINVSSQAAHVALPSEPIAWPKPQFRI